MKNKKQLNYGGFTLIELMIVIALIGILSTMILVSISSASSKARDARRAAELRAVKPALDMYAFDHNDTYPDCSDSTEGHSPCNVSGSGVEFEYAYNFNQLILYLKEKKYISEADFSNKKLAENSLWKFVAEKVLASVGPSYELVDNVKPQDPQYNGDETTEGHYYEYSVNAGKTNYRLRAKMENIGYTALASSQKGRFGEYAAGCDNTTVGFFALAQPFLPGLRFT